MANYNSDIPAMEAKRRADVATARAGGIGYTEAGRKEAYDQKRIHAPHPTPNFPGAPVIVDRPPVPISNGTIRPHPVKTLESTETLASTEKGFAIVGAVIAAIYAINKFATADGTSVLGYGIVGGIGGALAGAVLYEILMLTIKLLKIAIVVFGIALVLQALGYVDIEKAWGRVYRQISTSARSASVIDRDAGGSLQVQGRRTGEGTS